MTRYCSSCREEFPGSGPPFSVMHCYGDTETEIWHEHVLTRRRVWPVHTCTFGDASDSCAICERQIPEIWKNTRAQHFKESPGWKCVSTDEHWDRGCSQKPVGKMWFKYHLWVRSYRLRHPLDSLVGKGYGMKMDGQPLPWYVRLAYRLEGFPPEYRQRGGTMLSREERGKLTREAMARRCQVRSSLNRFTTFSGDRVFQTCLEELPCRYHSAVYCGDGARHYGPDQLQWFTSERLIAQGNFVGCGPHAVKHG